MCEASKCLLMFLSSLLDGELMFAVLDVAEVFFPAPHCSPLRSIVWTLCFPPLSPLSLQLFKVGACVCKLQGWFRCIHDKKKISDFRLYKVKCATFTVHVIISNQNYEKNEEQSRNLLYSSFLTHHRLLLSLNPLFTNTDYYCCDISVRPFNVEKNMYFDVFVHFTGSVIQNTFYVFWNMLVCLTQVKQHVHKHSRCLLISGCTIVMYLTSIT